MSNLQVKGFGALELSENGLAVQSFPTRHVEELLGYLHLNQNKTFGREELIDLLWLYDASENSRARFSTVLWRLRGVFKKLGVEASAFLRATRDHITFAPEEPLQFDVERFERQLEVAWSKKEDIDKLDELTRAVNLYQGELYSGIYVDWCLIERERLARKHMQALGELMHCHIRQNDLVKAIEIGQTILNIDPMREEVHRGLIFCHGKLGHRAEAAAQFQQCAHYMISELQVYPMPDTVRVYQQIMAGYMNNNVARSNGDMVERARRANIAFQKAGNKLIRILDEIENLQSATIS